MDQAQEKQPDGNFTAVPHGDEMDIDPPTKQSDNAHDAPMHEHWRSALDHTTHGEEDAKPTTTENLEKPPMPAWMTDPAGKAIITVMPSIDHKETEEAVAVHYTTATHMHFVGMMHIRRTDRPRPETGKHTPRQKEHQQPSRPSEQHGAQLQPRENPGIGAGPSAQVVQRPSATYSFQATNPFPMTGPPQAIRPEPHYIVIMQYAPSVEYGGSEFIFLQQDNYPQTGQFKTINHFTKAFVRLADAKHHALHLFTQRVSTDYRYVMQKAWEDLTPQEMRELGVSQDGPSPHVRGFVVKLIDERRVWQIRFGCDEEFCRISVLPVPPGDPRLEGLVLVGPGEKHGRIPKSLELERPPAETMPKEMASDKTISEETTAKEAESEDTAPEDSGLVEPMTDNMLPAETAAENATAERT